MENEEKRGREKESEKTNRVRAYNGRRMEEKDVIRGIALLIFFCVLSFVSCSFF